MRCGPSLHVPQQQQSSRAAAGAAAADCWSAASLTLSVLPSADGQDAEEQGHQWSFGHAQSEGSLFFQLGVAAKQRRSSYAAACARVANEAANTQQPQALQSSS